MSEISLIDSTGYDNIDNILIGVVGIFEDAFPDRIRAYHVTGSYSNRSAISNSDIDMTVTGNSLSRLLWCGFGKNSLLDFR